MNIHIIKFQCLTMFHRDSTNENLLCRDASRVFFYTKFQSSFSLNNRVKIVCRRNITNNGITEYRNLIHIQWKNFTNLFIKICETFYVYVMDINIQFLLMSYISYLKKVTSLLQRLPINFNVLLLTFFLLLEPQIF